MGLFLAEAAILGLLGGAVGGLFGVLLSRTISMSVFGSPGTVKPLSLALAVTCATLITLVGSTLPARRIAGLRPSEALRG